MLHEVPNDSYFSGTLRTIPHFEENVTLTKSVNYGELTNLKIASVVLLRNNSVVARSFKASLLTV